MGGTTTEASSGTLDFTGLLLGVLGFSDGEFAGLGYEDAGGVFHTAVLEAPDAVAAAAKIPETAYAAYFGVCPTSGPARTNCGRGTEADVTRLAALWIDLDVKPGGCPSLEVVHAVIDDLSAILGTRPSAVVDSGHGLHAYWEISDGHVVVGDVGAVRAIIRRWGRLAAVVAEKRGAAVDNVFDLARMMRIPGSRNNKSRANGADQLPVTGHPDIGGPLTLAEVDERLTEVGILEEPGDRDPHDKPISDLAEWEFATHTCDYVAAMLTNLPADGPPPPEKARKGRGRHQWAASQAVKLTCARRLGCISQPDFERARTLLERRLTELRAATGETVPRHEIGGLFKLGLQRTTTKTEEQCRAELGDHLCGDPASAAEAPTCPLHVEPVRLDEAHTVFRHWLGDDYDIDILDAMLATVAVEQLDGDPIWLLIISGSGNAKTETAQALDGIGAILTSTLTSDAALLSATPRRERGKNATGGLLRKIGDRGVLVIKDVTSILTMNRDMRARVLAALREIYDGRWYREVGADGGRTIEWAGRIAVVGAVTTAWDAAHAVIATMGDRFVLTRADSTKGRLEAGRQAILNTGSEEQMRAELATAAAGVIAGMQREPITPTIGEIGILLAAANLVTLARTGVEYDYRGDLVNAHAPEMPTRFAKQLAQIVRGGVAIGMDRDAALRLAIRCARDSMPPLRLLIIDDIAEHPGATLSDVHKRIDKPRTTTDRQLQALHYLGVLTLDEGRPATAFGKSWTAWEYSLADGIDPNALKNPRMT